MSVPDDFIKGAGPHLVEASAGTGKTTWMVATAVRLLLRDPNVNAHVERPERLLAVTFTRAATAELQERLREQLHRVKRVCDGEAPLSHESWISPMLKAGGDAMKGRLAALLLALDRLTVTTIHGFCMGVLEEFAFECGVPVGLRFLEDLSSYLDEAVADEWRTLTWERGPVSDILLKAQEPFTPADLARGAKTVRQAIGAERPARVNRATLHDAADQAMDAFATVFDAPHLHRYLEQVKFNKGGPTPESLDGLGVYQVMSDLYGEDLAKSAVDLGATKTSVERALRAHIVENPHLKLGKLVEGTLDALRKAGAVRLKSAVSVTIHHASR